MKTKELLQALATGLFLSITLITWVPMARGQTLPYAWGWGVHGQLGNNGAANSLVPGAVITTGVLAGKTVTAMAASYDHSLALSSDGLVTAWGAGNAGQIGNGQPGNNSTPNILVPVAVSTTGALAGQTVTAIAAGYQFSLALRSDGVVVAWGGNLSGQLGDNSTTQRDAPVAVDTAGALLNKTVVAIAAGSSHGLALLSDGTVAAWGNNAYGQLGNNSTANSSVPVAVSTTGALVGKTVVAIAAGGGDLDRPHSLALCSDGTVVGWGYNGAGELGDNSGTDSPVPVAVNITAGTSALFGKTVVAIAAGSSHSLALCSDGTVAAWGDNFRGQLGNNGTTGSALVPVAVNTTAGTSALFGKTVTSIAAGHFHSLALCSDGTLAAWGGNFQGALGDNTMTHKFAPVAVITTQSFTRVFSGSFALHTLGLASPCAPAVMNLAQYAGVTITGSIGCTYRIDYTTDLTAPVTWTPLTTNTLANSSYLFIDTNVISGIRFYRTVVQ